MDVPMKKDSLGPMTKFDQALILAGVFAMAAIAMAWHWLGTARKWLLASYQGTACGILVMAMSICGSWS